MSKSAPNSLPDLQCACANLRRAARLVTQLYSLEMGSHIDPAQFALLSTLSHLPGTCQAPLGRILGLDKTTLSRNLSVLQRKGWISLNRSEDLREKVWYLTPAGEKILTDAKPGWQRAQARLHAAMSPAQWQSMSKIVGQVAEAAISASR